MGKISKHITYEDAVRSDMAKRLGISNDPTISQLMSMCVVAEKIYEPLARYFGVPIYISSFFRTTELNRAMGGSTTSQHCKGEAVDVDADFYGRISNRDIFEYVRDNLDFDQLIWEGGTDIEPAWVHISYTTRRKNRKQILKLRVYGTED